MKQTNFRTLTLYSLILLLQLLLHSNLFAQIKIGDQIPEHELPGIINTDFSTKKLSEYKGKLVILDFWSIGCHSCVEGIPHMQSLQNEFEKDVQIILVNTQSKLWGDTKEKVNKIIESMQKRLEMKIDLPCSINDDVLDKVIYGPVPSSWVGFQVWISSKGEVIGITLPEFVTAENIKKILSGEKLNFPNMQFSPWLQSKNNDFPLSFSNGSIVKIDSSVKYHCEVYQGGRIGTNLVGNPKMNRDNNTINGTAITNSSLRNLYAEYYTDIFQKPWQDLVVKVKDPDLANSLLMDWSYKDDLFNSKVVAIDLYSSKALTTAEINADIKNTLDKAFGKLYFARTIAAKKCLLIKSNKNISDIISKGGVSDDTFSGGSDDYAKRKYIHNEKINTLLRFIAKQFGLPQWQSSLIDETGVTQNIDFELPANVNLSTKEKMIAYWKTVGLELSEVTRQVPAVLITDEKPADEKKPVAKPKSKRISK